MIILFFLQANVSIKDNYSSDGFLKCRFKPIPKGTQITITV